MSSTRNNRVQRSSFGRGAAICAPLLLLCLLISCGKKKATGPVISGYVRLPELMKVHPGYPELEKLDRMIKSLETPLAKSAAVAPNPELKPFAPLPGSPAVRLSEPMLPKDSHDLSKDRIKFLVDQLSKHDVQVVARQRHLLEKRVAAELSAERTRLLSLPSEPLDTPARAELRRKLRLKLIEQIALQSEERVLTIPAVVPVRARLAELDKEIATLRSSMNPPKAENDSILDSKIAELKKKKDEEVDAKVAEVAQTLLEGRDKLAKEYSDRFESKFNAIKPTEPLTLPATKTVIVQAQRPEMGRTSIPVKGGETSAKSIQSLRTYRTQLEAYLILDTRRQALRIAEKSQWKVSFNEPENSKGSTPDLTLKIADKMREDRSPFAK
ncbi:MAG: hypothetical protein ABJA67_08700 [Chthonomonadales bacterium]